MIILLSAGDWSWYTKLPQDAKTVHVFGQWMGQGWILKLSDKEIPEALWNGDCSAQHPILVHEKLLFMEMVYARYVTMSSLQIANTPIRPYRALAVMMFEAPMLSIKRSSCDVV
jgi:hypothetical protein